MSEAIIVVLFLIILSQVFERYMYAVQSKQERMRYLDEISRSQKAIISKNANEYMAALAMDRVVKDDKKVETDEVLLSEADDHSFDAHIKAQTQ